MRRISIALPAVLLTATALLATGCQKKPQQGNGDGGAAPRAEAGKEDSPSPAPGEPLLIGEVGSLSGAEATYGLATQRGIELAINEVNAAGGVKGRKLRLRVYDDQSKPEEAGNAATRLIAQDHALVILGEAASTNSLAMAEKAQAAGVPMISPSSTSPAVTEKGDYIFRVCFIDPFQGFVMARFARENLGVARVAVLQDIRSAYSLGLTDHFVRKFTELGGEVVASESFSKGDTDFRAQLTTFKATKPEALYLPAYYSDVGIIARQARELGLTVPLLGGDGWDSPKLFELGGSAIEGGYFSTHYSLDNPSARSQKFIADFQKAYGQPPEVLSALGYDAALLAVDAMGRAKELTGPAVRDALAATKDFPGVTGSITFDQKRNPIKPAVVVQVVEGRFKYVAAVTP